MQRIAVSKWIAAAVVVVAMAGDSIARDPHEDSDMEHVAAAYRELRAVRGHFDGGPWREEVDRWDGAKHRLMQRLAGALVARRAATDAVLAWLGPPDATIAASSADPGAVCWIYRWRGERDQLALRIVATRVAAAEWRYAYE